MSEQLGPNVKRLITEKASQDMVNRATNRFGNASVGSVAQGILNGDLQACLRDATQWVRAALAAARKFPDAAKWPTDEDMAGEILRRIAEKRQKGGANGAA